MFGRKIIDSRRTAPSELRVQFERIAQMQAELDSLRMAAERPSRKKKVNETDLYADILALNQTAAAARQYEVAYHLLAAALHAAEIARDTERIEAILRLAIQQGVAVDGELNHPMAADNARKRGNTPLYESLAGTARAKLAQIESQRVIDERQVVPNQDVLEDE